jgi:hypothetical protein
MHTAQIQSFDETQLPDSEILPYLSPIDRFSRLPDRRQVFEARCFFAGLHRVIGPRELCDAVECYRRGGSTAGIGRKLVEAREEWVGKVTGGVR